MKLILEKYPFLLLAFLLIIPGCQRDDICPEATDTTPLLIIRFFDFTERDRPRSPTNLRITDIERDSVLYNRLNTDSINLPLKTNEDRTRYAFTIFADEDNDDDDEFSPDTDTLTFNYAREEIYVNRACAFKVNFRELKVTREGGEDGTWIENFAIEQTDVEDETLRHISIYY